MATGNPNPEQDRVPIVEEAILLRSLGWGKKPTSNGYQVNMEFKKTPTLGEPPAD